jgi:hypothetical protein
MAAYKGVSVGLPPAALGPAASEPESPFCKVHFTTIHHSSFSPFSPPFPVAPRRLLSVLYWWYPPPARSLQIGTSNSTQLIWAYRPFSSSHLFPLFKMDLLEMEGEAPIQGASPRVYALAWLGLRFSGYLGSAQFRHFFCIPREWSSSSGVFGGVWLNRYQSMPSRLSRLLCVGSIP